MKTILSILTLTVLTALPTTGFAATKKEMPAATPAATPAAKPADAAKPAKALPMSTKVDAIDAKAKTFTHTNKDGAVVKFMLTDATEIKNGEAAAKFEDIKVGDQVSGLRMKKGANEWEVVKITKFGPKAEKMAEADAKPGPAAAPAAPAATPAKKK